MDWKIHYAEFYLWFNTGFYFVLYLLSFCYGVVYAWGYLSIVTRSSSLLRVISMRFLMNSIASSEFMSAR